MSFLKEQITNFRSVPAQCYCDINGQSSLVNGYKISDLVLQFFVNFLFVQ